MLKARAVATLVLAALAATVAADATAADAAADAAALSRLERSLASLSSVRAEFRQQLIEADGSAGATARGTLYLKKPGRFRWDYSQPQQLIVCDGETLWLYDPELEQATVRRVAETLSQTPAMLLSGQGRVGDGFTVNDAGASGGLSWVKLTPRLAQADFRELKLGFEGADLKRLEFTDKLNAITRIEFTRIERNVRLDQALFTFVAPAGVDVIGEPRH